MGFGAEEGWLKKLYIEGSAMEVAESENNGKKRNREGMRWMKGGSGGESGFIWGLRFCLYSSTQVTRYAMIGIEFKDKITPLVLKFLNLLVT